MRFDLTDEEWVVIEPHLPKTGRGPVQKKLKSVNNTQVVFRDNAFADGTVKTNMVTILEQNGIAHV